MSRRLIALLVVAVGLVAALTLPSGRAAPGTDFRLESFLPARTVAFASVEGIGTWKERVDQTAIGKLSRDPEMQAFLKPILDEMQAKAEGHGDGAKPGEKDGPMHPPPFPPVVMKLLEQAKNLRGQAAIGLMDWQKHGGPVLAASLDFGEHVSDFVAFLTKMKDEMKDETKGGGIPIKTSERNGRTFWELDSPSRSVPPAPPAPPGPDGDPRPPVAPPAMPPGADDMPRLAATTIGSAFVLSTDRAWLESVADANGAALPSPLAQTAEFTGVREQTCSDCTALFLYANVPEILSLTGVEGKEGKALKALGIDTVKAAGYGLAFSGDGFLDTLIVHAPDADHGILPLLRRRPVTHAALPLVPSSAFYYEEDTTPLSTALPKIRQIASQIDDDAAREIDRALAKVRETTGVDAEKDLLAGLADDWAVYAGLPETGGVYPEAAIVIGVKDPVAYEAILEKAVNGLAGDVTEHEQVKMTQRTIEYHGKRLHVVDLDAAKRHDVVPFTPTWTMIKDRLVVTLVPHTMKEIVLRSEGDGSAGLSSQEDFQALLRAAPEGAGSFTYLDTQSLLSLAYDTLVPLAETAAKPAVFPMPLRLDWAQLPAARTVRPYFRSLATFSTVDAQGFRFSMHSPIAMLPLVAIGAAVLVGTMKSTGQAGHHLVSVPTSPIHPMGDPRSMNLMLAHMTLEKLVMRIEIFRVEQGSLPETLEELEAKSKPAESIPLDPWKNELRYRIVDAKAGTAELRSAGPNGVFGDEDDVVTTLSASK